MEFANISFIKLPESRTGGVVRFEPVHSTAQSKIQGGPVDINSSIFVRIDNRDNIAQHLCINLFIFS